MYSNENRLSRKGMWCAADNHNFMNHICAKEFLDSNFNEAGIDKLSKFSRNGPKIHILTKLVILKV